MDNPKISECLIKEFILDDEKLNQESFLETEYFENLIEEINFIYKSERKFIQKLLNIYEKSLDYTKDTKVCKELFEDEK